ncbi:hypothetical protein [Mycobacterium sp. NPDC006124]|uniref:hypothetical protein n=1 Tax=Mycobacterium sp. NPDC006124 TaxID=3156729 RepID=UPI0033BF9AEF
MRRAYVESHEPLPRALALALRWAGEDATIHAPDTRSVEENKLDQLGLPVTSPSSKSRYHDLPRGTVVGFFLNLAEVLDVERSDVNGLVVVGAQGPSRFPGVPHHGPWVTAFAPEHLGGQEIAPVTAAPAALRAAIEGLTGIAVGNQGLLDKRERSEVIHALTFLRSRGFALDPDALMVEALRNEWGGSGAEELRQIAVDLNKGKQLRFDRGRLRPERLEEWAAAGD